MKSKIWIFNQNEIKIVAAVPVYLVSTAQWAEHQESDSNMIVSSNSDCSLLVYAE